MTNETILRKTIEKAVKNGWNEKQWADILMMPDKNWLHNHDFAKAFWGEEDIEDSYWNREKREWVQRFEWSAHLQQMVLEKEPLKYLEKFL